ncbi:O-methyltransferase [Lentibacillus cibarius]|uniref:tRNA 5-hydroxyuridine methyltransferase n=1 Tax=Lentibacillus cibarius TaxID=2583219 RepID=A0A5S3QGU6_9BACI|nr:O-methyltransferase [Lentibacillus cibarius]TMN21037.1 O-methyltransferase [Lentibacillus cibarius]
MNDTLTDYLMKSLPSEADWVKDLEQKARNDQIPIMDPLGMNLVMQLIRLTKPERILEIGTAVGYSALRMAEANSNASIVSIERDEQRYRQAVANIREMDKLHIIDVICGDATEELPKLTGNKFDMVLIDAAKGAYKEFFELSVPLLSNDGFVVTDNVLFKGFVADTEKQHPRYQKIAAKIRAYNDWLVKHPDFTTTIVPIGDGIAISKKI